MYAVVRTGGKQYRVEPGQQLRTERLPGAEGDTVELTEILMIGGDDGVTIGTPLVADARVVAEIVAQGRHKPVTVFKYKNKIRYRRLHRHRQLQTTLSIQEIFTPGGGGSTASGSTEESLPKDVSEDLRPNDETVAPTSETSDDEVASSEE